MEKERVTFVSESILLGKNMRLGIMGVLDYYYGRILLNGSASNLLRGQG